MQVDLKNVHLNLQKYDDILSLGTNCVPGMYIYKLNLSKEKIPIFNDVVTTPKLIYDCLQHNFKYYNELQGKMERKDEITYNFLKLFKLDNKIYYNEYGIFFKNQKDYTLDNLKDLIQLQINIFQNKLKSNKSLIFIFTSEDTISFKDSLEQKDEYDKYLKLIEKFFINNYPNLKFKILAFHTNKDYINTNNIINFNIKISKEYIEDNIDKNYLRNCNDYRLLIEDSIKKIFDI